MSALTSAAARSLVDGLLVREGRLHLGLPRRVGRERVALRVRPRGVQREELLGEVVDRACRTRCLARSHSVPPSLRQRRPLPARVAADPADLLDRDEDPVPAGERQLEVVAVLARAAAAEHLLVAGDAMVDVDDEVARRQPLEDVARDDPAQGSRPPDADGPEQLAVGDEGEAVRAADEPAVQAPVDERDRTRRRRLRDPSRRCRTGWSASARRSASRGAWSEARTIRCAVAAPALDGLDQAAGPTRRQGGLPPAERVARRQAAARHRGVLGRLGSPRSARGSARRRAGPSSRAAAGTSRASPSAARRRPRARRGARRPGATGTRRPRRCRRARRGRAACPARGGRDRSPGRGGRPRPRRRPRRPWRGRRAAPPRPDAAAAARIGSVPSSPSNRARSAASRSGSRAADRPRRSRIAVAPPGRQQELGRGQEHGPIDRRRPSAGRSGRTRAASRSRRRRTRCGSGSGSDGGKTSTMPPRRAEFAAAGDLGDRHVAEVEELVQQGVLVEAGAGPQLARRVREVGRGDRVLEERLDARDEDPRTAARARRRGRRRGPRSRRRSARCARRRAPSAARATATAPGSPSQAPSSSATRSPISASRAIQTSRSPSGASARAAAR